MKLSKSVTILAFISALATSISLGFTQTPASACLTPWTDDCDWIDDDVLPEAGDVDEMVLPKADIYVTNKSDETIYVTVSHYEGYYCNNHDGCNGGNMKVLGNWEIGPNETDVFILDNVLTLDDEDGEAAYSFEARSVDSSKRWKPKLVNLNGSRRFNYTFNP